MRTAGRSTGKIVKRICHQEPEDYIQRNHEEGDPRVA